MTENRVRDGAAPIYTESELVEIIARGEGQFLEFKSAWDRSRGGRRPLPRRALRDKIAEVVAAFANADGGLLLVGVDDDGTPSGHGYPETVVEGLLAVPSTRLDRGVPCRTARGRIGDCEVLIFDTIMTPEAVMVEGNGFPYRAGAKIMRVRQETIEAKKEAYQRASEPLFNPNATMDMLDLGLVQRFMDRTPMGGRPAVDALAHYRLIGNGPDDWRITNAALLLFERRTEYPVHLRAGIRLFRVAGTERRHGGERNVTQLAKLEPPVADALRDALLIGRTHIRRAERFNGMEFETHWEIPDFALQEAIVNAVAHRDYEIRSRETEVWFYEDRVEIESPGGVLPPATEAALRAGHPAHASRNPLLVKALTAADYMRDEGEGVRRIHQVLERRFLPPPEISVEQGIFTIRLFNGRPDGGMVAEPALAWPNFPPHPGSAGGGS